jgi:uncharacterized protein (TIGR03435 family)
MKTFPIPYIASPVNYSYATIRILILVILIPSVYGEGPNFEVASIKPAPPIDPGQFMDTRCHGGPGTKDPGRWTCANISLSNLVVTIFDLKGFQIGAVASVPTDRFTIAAKVPEGTTEEQFRQMKLNLLAERFGLKFHREKREIQGYELIVAKDGPKFKESEPEPPKDPDADPDAIGTLLPKMTAGKDAFPVIPPGRTQVIMRLGAGARGRGQWSRITMEAFATALFGAGLAGLKPVIDGTGLKGKYDLSLDWAPDIANPAAAAPTAESGIPAAPEPSGPNIFTALQQQLGLKLQPKKVTIEILVIDHIEKTPTEN